MRKRNLKQVMPTFDRCVVCRAPLRVTNTTGYCQRHVDKTKLYQCDPEFKKKTLAKNAAWHATHREQLAAKARARYQAKKKSRLAAAPDSSLDSNAAETEGMGLHPTASDGSASGVDRANAPRTIPPAFETRESDDASGADANTRGTNELGEKTGAKAGGLDSISDSKVAPSPASTRRGR